jgi:hypothetical protein
MTRPILARACVVTAFVAVAWVSPAFAQASAGKPLAAASQTTSSSPRTPWGDPDIQGNYTNLWEAGTPFERPDQFVGRRIEDITREELLKMRLAIQDRTREEQLAGEIGGTRWIWLDSHNHAKGSMPWFVVDPADGRIPPLTAEGQARQAARATARKASGRGPADSYTDRSLYDRCITRGLPGSMMPAIYGNSYRIVQAPGFVAITYEMIHETRVIPLDLPAEPSVTTEGSRRLVPSMRQYMGNARGRWEGDTLVVETTNFRDETAYRGASAATLKLVERFTRMAPDPEERRQGVPGNQLRWSVTVDDPSTWTRPWTFAMPLTQDDSEPLFEYGCHEGNYAMVNILSGARAEEAAAREKRQR